MQIASYVKKGKEMGGCSGLKGGSGTPTACPKMQSEAVNASRARERLGTKFSLCQDE